MKGIQKRLLVVGILCTILSTVLATQYATTKAGYTYGIVHPSNADIRFVGSDNNSDDNIRVLRVSNNASGSQYLQINMGDWLPNTMKNYTAAFAIVNEEQFLVNITHVNVSGDASTYIDVWLHTNRTTEAALETAANAEQVISAGVTQHTASSVAWVLAAGDGDLDCMNGTGTYGIQTPWDGTAHVRYNHTTAIYAQNGTRDWVWVQISLNIPSTASLDAAATGQIWFHFTASTHTEAQDAEPCECGDGHIDNGDGTCTATFDNPTEDGTIAFSLLEMNWEKITGENTIDFMSGAMPRCGFIEWNISSIPDGATIEDAIFYYHGNTNTGDNEIYQLLVQPSASTGDEIYGGIDTLYTDDENFPVVGPNQQIDVGADAESDIQNQLNDGWFAILISGAGGVPSKIYAEEYGDANPKPTLEVTYTPS
ncbi:MAG: hypothetical protein JXA00_05950 [Candidatus Thermoplasmatota archaeon]|nr:hypothetical protein [Candidatus Thermoplasmatota archaeon]